jgi:hypothetical protein
LDLPRYFEHKDTSSTPAFRIGVKGCGFSKNLTVFGAAKATTNAREFAQRKSESLKPSFKRRKRFFRSFTLNRNRKFE